MNHIAIVDTCIFLNVLDIPGFNQDRATVLEELEKLLAAQSANLLLPFSAILETGNHVARLSDGGQRRKYAQLFVDQVNAALIGDAPWTPTQTIDLAGWMNWLKEYPDRAMAGMGLGDLSILKEWQAACERHPDYRVRIWSIDGHLTGFDRAASRLIRTS